MIRSGIVSREQIASKLRRGKPLPPIACTVLEELDENLSNVEELAIDLIYQGLSGGPTKTKFTRRRRYQHFDPIVIEEMERLFPAESLLRVHDMAASSAITSLEFYTALTGWDNVKFHATDYFDTAIVVSIPNTGWQVVFDIEHRPSQFIGKRLVISCSRTGRKRHRVNELIQRMLNATILPRAIRILEGDDQTKRRYTREIRLFHPKCLATAVKDRRFTLGRHNILESDRGQYEVVRLMGVVRSFPNDLIRPMFEKICECIVDGGLLVVGRHEGKEKVPGGVFQRHGRRLVLVRA